VYHAAGLLRLLGRLSEPRSEVVFAARLEAFLHFQRQERCLSPCTLHHYEICVGEFLNWVGRQGKPLEEVVLEDISGYFQSLAQRKLKRTSIALLPLRRVEALVPGRSRGTRCASHLSAGESSARSGMERRSTAACSLHGRFAQRDQGSCDAAGHCGVRRAQRRGAPPAP
jgi:hypothetical protein